MPAQPIALVVDDEPIVRVDTAEMVEGEGFEVVEARTVDEAYDFLERYPSLRLVLTDIRTPGDMDGCELAWEIAKRWPSICVVVACEEGRPASTDLPPTAVVVTKPLTADVVHEAIEEYCGCDAR